MNIIVKDYPGMLESQCVHERKQKLSKQYGYYTQESHGMRDDDTCAVTVASSQNPTLVE